MIYVKVNDTLYPASISGKMQDRDWDNRPTKTITAEMTYEEAVNIWVEGVAWSIVQEVPVDEVDVDDNGNPIVDEFGNPMIVQKITYDEFDNADYNMAGEIIDHRDGTTTIRMGKLTDLEVAVGLLLGGEV